MLNLLMDVSQTDRQHENSISPHILQGYIQNGTTLWKSNKSRAITLVQMCEKWCVAIPT